MTALTKERTVGMGGSTGRYGNLARRGGAVSRVDRMNLTLRTP
jgi:hypothetical protein